MKIPFVFFFALFCLPWAHLAYPQKRDTAFVAAAIESSIARYTKSMHGQSNLYNGSEYRSPRRTNEQHPYFASEDWVDGSIVYDHDLYESIAIQYDLTSDALVTELYTNSNPIALVDSKVEGFVIEGHTFRRLCKDTLTELPETGFYDVLYEGRTQVIVRRQKSMQQKLEERAVVIDFEERNRYFILHGGRYHTVKSKRSVLSILKNRQGDIKKFLRANRLKFRDDKDTALRKIAEFYDTAEH